MHIWLRGRTAQIFLIVCAIFGFLTGLAFVADFYTAHWTYCVPATLLYAVGLWFFAMPKADPDESQLQVFATKLILTLVFVGVTFAAIAAAIWIYKLILDNWHYVLIAAIIIAGILIWALVAAAIESRKERRARENPLEAQARVPPPDAAS